MENSDLHQQEDTGMQRKNGTQKVSQHIRWFTNASPCVNCNHVTFYLGYPLTTANSGVSAKLGPGALWGHYVARFARFRGSSKVFFTVSSTLLTTNSNRACPYKRLSLRARSIFSKRCEESHWWSLRPCQRGRCQIPNMKLNSVARRWLNNILALLTWL